MRVERLRRQERDSSSKVIAVGSSEYIICRHAGSEVTETMSRGCDGVTAKPDDFTATAGQNVFAETRVAALLLPRPAPHSSLPRNAANCRAGCTTRRHPALGDGRWILEINPGASPGIRNALQRPHAAEWCGAWRAVHCPGSG